MSITISQNSFVKRQKDQGTIDTKHLSPELAKAMQAAGVSAAQLQNIAGPDGLINDSKEFKKLYKLLDGFDAKPGDKNLQLDGAMGELNTALKAEVKANRAQDKAATKFARKSSGGINTDNLSNGLSQAMQQAGMSAADLKGIAGKDGLITSKDEYKKLYKLLDGFDSTPGDKTLQKDAAMGDLVSAINGEGKLNKTHDKFAAYYAKEQAKNYGVIDTNNLSPELTKAMGDAGVTAADLKQIAGLDERIKSPSEFKKLYKLLDRVDSNPGDKTLQKDGTAGALHQALKDEVTANRKLAPYMRPGGQRASERPELTVDAARVVPQPRKEPVQLDVKLQIQSEYEDLHGLERSTGCRATCEAGIEEYLKKNKKNFDEPPKLVKRNQLDNNIQVGYAEDSSGHLAVDKSQAKIANDYIDRTLDAGLPVMVGASHYDYWNTGNADKLSEHWVSITGRDYDDQNRLFYTFNDPGNGKQGRFYVDEDTGKLFKVPEYGTGSEWAKAYLEMTQVRPYEGD